jgi:hypothetical protein
LFYSLPRRRLRGHVNDPPDLLKSRNPDPSCLLNNDSNQANLDICLFASFNFSFLNPNIVLSTAP